MADEKCPVMMIRRGTMLCPMGPLDSEEIMRVPASKPVRVRVTMPRSVPRLRLYWAALGKVCENLDYPLKPESLHEWLKLELGYSVLIKAKSGNVYVPGSIAFDKMDEPEFAAYFDQAVTLLVTRILPGIGKKALVEEARAMLGEVVQ